MKSFFKSVGEKTTSAFNEVISSHKAMENTGIAVAVISNPKKITFDLFYQAVLDSLREPVKCQKISLSKADLKYYFMLANLSDEVYHKAEKRTIPEEAGVYVYEDTNCSVDRTPYFILNSDKLNKIFVVIRGSYTFADFITDAKASADEIDGVLIHSGVYAASNALYVRSEGLLCSLSKEHNNRQIVFTGHSLGSGVAAVSASLMRKHHPELDIKAVCFAPVASMSADAIEDTKSYITTFALGGDPIPFLSLHNVAQVSQKGLPKVINDFVQDAVSRDIVRPIELPPNFDIDSNPFEQPPPSMDQIKEDLKTVSRRTTALYPPGNAIHIVFEGTTFKRVSLEQIEDNIDYFGSFTKHIDETHHSMVLYKDCLEELLRQATE